MFLDQSARGLSAPPQDKLEAPPRASLLPPQPRPRPPFSLSLGRKASPSPASSTPTPAVHSHPVVRGALGEGRSDRDPPLGFPSRSARSLPGRPAGLVRQPLPRHPLPAHVSDPPGEVRPSSGSASSSSAWNILPSDPCAAASFPTSGLPCPADQKGFTRLRQVLLYFFMMITSI